jgi:myo-inositol catabolism protein IolH
MKIALGAGFQFGQEPLDDAARKMREVGYEYIELHTGAHVDPEAPDDEVIAQRRVLEARGVKVGALLGGTQTASLDEEARANAVKVLNRQIRAAALLETNMLTSEMIGGTIDRQDECIDAFKRSMDEVAPALEANDVRIAFEPHPGDFIEEHALGAEVLRSIGNPRIGYLYCCPHTFILGEDPAAMIESVSDILTWVHIADTFRVEKIVVSYAREGMGQVLGNQRFDGMNAHLHLPPGLGEVDFGAVFGALAKIGYDGFVSVIPMERREPVRVVAEALEFVREHMTTSA